MRLDTTMAFHEDATSGASGHTLVFSLIASRKVSARVAPLFRLSWVRLSLPDGATTIPVGQGGGDAPEPGTAAAIARGIPARSAMDNALFAVNYWTVIWERRE